MTTPSPIQEKKITQTSYSNIIGAKHVPAHSGRTLPVINPATGELLGTCPASDKADVEEAVKAARAALEGKWGRTAPSVRTKLLFKAAQLLDERANELAQIESRNNGKVLSHVLGEIKQAVEDFEFFAGAATKASGSVPPIHGAYFGYTIKEPVGVVGAITPWNYPLMLEAWKLAPALAAGCSVVLKPSELTPITANLLVEILIEAGIPEGTVNVVHGLGHEAGAALVAHPGVDKIAFTGGTETGREIMRMAAATMKRLTLELGGKSPAIVCDDANLDDAVYGSLFSIFYSAGQSCEARSRIYVHETVYDRFAEKFVAAAKSLKVGDPFDKATQVGALISPERLSLMESFVESAKHDGGRVLCGGHRLTDGALAQGNFFEPTVIDNLPHASRCVQEEIFGPIAVLAKWKEDDEVISSANGVKYGLAAAVWTQNLNRAQKFTRAIHSGIVAVNTFATALPGLPFGGYKQSGFGREMGLETMDTYLETKTVLMSVSGKPVNPFGVKV
jgi:acyl-CoA reductase-like NAD-dependent aldehyde dehydrogenase